MVVKNLKLLRRLIAIQELTLTDVANAAGWKAHSYVARLLSGEATTLKVEPATLIAKKLGVPVDELFVLKVASSAGQPTSPTSRTKKVAA